MHKSKNNLFLIDTCWPIPSSSNNFVQQFPSNCPSAWFVPYSTFGSFFEFPLWFHWLTSSLRVMQGLPLVNDHFRSFLAHILLIQTTWKQIRWVDITKTRLVSQQLSLQTVMGGCGTSLGGEGRETKREARHCSLYVLFNGTSILDIEQNSVTER